MITDEKYQIYAGTVAGEVPEEHLKHIINVMIEDAALNMGSSYDKKIIDRIIEFVKSRDFNYMPLSVIASAFARGSLGKFGPGRLVPKTVHDWLDNVAEEYRRHKEHQEREARYRNPDPDFDLHKFPVGKAIIQKITWLKSEVIDENGWDKIPLKDLAERIASGLPAVPELFGVKSKSKNHE